jgi:hypothetical protein
MMSREANLSVRYLLRPNSKLFSIVPLQENSRDQLGTILDRMRKLLVVS